MRPAIRHIRTRILLVFMALLVLVLGMVLLAVYRASLDNAKQEVARQFRVAGQTFKRLMDQRSRQLETGVRLLAGDYALRQAVADQDLATSESALANHAARIGADLTMLVDLDGRILINTLGGEHFGEHFPCQRLVEVAEERGGSSGYVRLDGVAYQVVLTPVRAPEPVAWLVMGFRVSDETARDFRALTGAEVNFMSFGDEGVRLLASSLEGRARQQAQPWLAGFDGEDYRPRSVRLGGEENWFHFVRLDSASALDYVAALNLSLDAALAPYKALRIQLLAISAAALLVFAAGALILSGRLTRPIGELVAGVDALGRGEYGARVEARTRDELGALARGFNRMAEEIAQRQQQVEFLAYYDGLTGLPNRTYFVEQVERALRHGELHYAVFVAGLARLKPINFSLGFAVGDDLLRALAVRLDGRTDWLAARLAGDKLAFCCPLDAAGNDVDAWEARIRQAVETPIDLAGQLYDLGLHLGVAWSPEHGAEAEPLLRRAELAMRRGMHTVGARVDYQPEFDAGGVRRVALLNDLRAGIEGGQLLAVFQPKARLADGRVVACELLIRWRHPEHGLVFPDEFIPAAEQSTLIKPLTGWVIDAAAGQAAGWRGEGLELAVAVNLSARNLQDEEVIGQIRAALDRHGLPAMALIAEITESALMEDTDTALRVIRGIAALGVRVAIDDFGAGFSSLNLLSRMPVDELKIDRAFVMRMHESPQDRAIVQSTIELAHTLGMSVVAEGVEDRACWDKLLAFGCDVAQGYFLSRPMEAAAFEAWLRQRG